jgi:hypothetical protein
MAMNETSESVMPSAPTIWAAMPVAPTRSPPGPVVDSPNHSSSAAMPAQAIRRKASSSVRVRVQRSSLSLWASRPRASLRLTIDRTSRRRPTPER